MGNKENKETKAMTHSVHMVQSLSFNHSNSCSLSREWYTYIDVDGTGIGGEIELQYGEDMEEFLWKSFSHNPILSLSIQELARCQNMSGKLHWRMLRNHIISCGKPRKQFKQIADLQDKFWFTVLHILLFQGALEITSVWMMITDEICWDHDHCSIERVTLFYPITGRTLSVAVHQDWSFISSITTLPTFLNLITFIFLWMIHLHSVFKCTNIMSFLGLN